ncbi:hypothetical protein SLOPH_1788 [Spraguea lophii 42_110]|uniref:RRM domain-containing protein n=1 Tax=Spraguea lophii (strain 42_110) TaxID=1358809 RepID=S7XL41_SPRLO|nr:hypothetical protein SLOPH_1788 [Spraguea lophii 42_110]
MNDTNFSLGIKLIKKLKQGKVIKVAFVEFATAESAAKVISEEEIKVAGDMVKPAYSVSRFAGGRRKVYPSKTRVKLYNVPEDMQAEDKLCDLLGKCTIIKSKRPTNFIIAQFENENMKNEAVEKNNGKQLNDSNVLKIEPAYPPRRFLRRG